MNPHSRERHRRFQAICREPTAKRLRQAYAERVAIYNAKHIHRSDHTNCSEWRPEDTRARRRFGLHPIIRHCHKDKQFMQDIRLSHT